MAHAASRQQKAMTRRSASAMPHAMGLSASQTETLTVATPGVDLAVRVGGAGPLVVLMHGFPDTWHTWDAMEAPLHQAGFRTANLALRGYAPSGLPRAGDYGLKALAGDMIAVLDHLGEGHAHLIGHDWGATIAYAVAALYPDRVKRMVTLADPPPLVFPGGWRERLTRPHNIYLAQGAVSAWLLHRRNAQLVDHLYRAWSPGWAVPADHLVHVRQTFSDPQRGARSGGLLCCGHECRRAQDLAPAIVGADSCDLRGGGTGRAPRGFSGRRKWPRPGVSHDGTGRCRPLAAP